MTSSRQFNLNSAKTKPISNTNRIVMIQILRTDAYKNKFTGRIPYELNASNHWAIDAKKTSSGKLICNRSSGGLDAGDVIESIHPVALMSIENIQRQCQKIAFKSLGGLGVSHGLVNNFAMVHVLRRTSCGKMAVVAVPRRLNSSHKLGVVLSQNPNGQIIVKRDPMGEFKKDDMILSVQPLQALSIDEIKSRCQAIAQNQGGNALVKASVMRKNTDGELREIPVYIELNSKNQLGVKFTENYNQPTYVSGAGHALFKYGDVVIGLQSVFEEHAFNGNKPNIMSSLANLNLTGDKIEKFVLNLAEDEQWNVIKGCQKLIASDAELAERQEIFEILQGLPPLERVEYVEKSLELFSNSMNQSQRIRVLKVLQDMPCKERSEFVRLIMDFNLVNMPKLSRILVMDKLKEVPYGIRKNLLEKAKLLISNDMDGWTLKCVLTTLSQLSGKELEQFVSLVKPLIKAHMEAGDIKKIMEAVKVISSHERENMVSLIRVLISEEMTGEDIRVLLKELQDVSSDDREDVVFKVKDLVNRKRPSYLLCPVMRIIRDVPVKERDNFVNCSKRLNLMELRNLTMIVILQQIAAIEVGERTQRVERAYNDLHRHPLIHNRSARMRELLSTPLNQDLPPLMEENGIDVHFGDRDQRSYSAMDLLEIHNGPINNPSSMFNDMISELKQFNAPLMGQKRTIALRVLTEPVHDEKSNNWVWQPLHNNIVHVGGRALNGTLFLAHLWKFCIQPADYNERVNRIFSLINGLANSVEDHQRLCPPGQVQHLVVSVLQGRLPGVNIDNFTVSTPEAMRLFFLIDGHSKLETRLEINAAVQKFLNENPMVDKDDFLNGVSKYCQVSDFS
jgi:hypothetical protein